MNDESKTVYIVTSGSYSDYNIDAVFDDKERAEALARMIEDAEIEEWPLNPPFSFNPREHAGMLLWRVYYCARWFRDQNEWWAVQSNPLEHQASSWEPDPLGTGYGGVFVWASDKEHALKIAQDKRAEYLAHEAGIS